MSRHDKSNELRLKAEFEQVFSSYFQRMYLYARKLLKSDHLAEDAVEEVFYNLWKTRSDFSEIMQIETYLFVSVKNQVIKMLSKDQKNFESYDTKGEVSEVEKTNPEDILLEKELLALIESEVSKLPEQCQIIFRMSRNQQMEYHEIAESMGISVENVRSQVCKALNRIRLGIESRKDPTIQSVSS